MKNFVTTSGCTAQLTFRNWFSSTSLPSFLIFGLNPRGMCAVLLCMAHTLPFMSKTGPPLCPLSPGEEVSRNLTSKFFSSEVLNVEAEFISIRVVKRIQLGEGEANLTEPRADGKIRLRIFEHRKFLHAL